MEQGFSAIKLETFILEVIGSNISGDTDIPG
jgi:hypothetical protein